MLIQTRVHTNRQGAKYISQWNEEHPENQKEWKDITMEELQAFICVLIVGGRNGGRKLRFDEVWNENDLFKR